MHVAACITAPHDALTAELEIVGPKAGATAVEPVESALELYNDGVTSIGIWSCTPGAWASEKIGLGELMHFVAGHGWIVDATVRKLYVKVATGTLRLTAGPRAIAP